MKTPAGKECAYYYEDFHRGRNQQECRLINANPDSSPWGPRDCSTCPAPEILWANASEHLHLHGTVKMGILGFGRRIEIDATCDKHERVIKDPYQGCSVCAAERPNIEDMLSDIDIE